MLQASMFGDNGSGDGFSLVREWTVLRSSKRVLLALVAFGVTMLVTRLLPANTSGGDSLTIKLSSGDYMANPLYSEPLVEETIPTWLVLLLAAGVPSFAALAMAVVSRIKGDFEAFVCGLVTSVWAQAMVAETLKLICGYRRL
jgi:hypothetical protein